MQVNRTIVPIESVSPTTYLLHPETAGLLGDDTPEPTPPENRPTSKVVHWWTPVMVTQRMLMTDWSRERHSYTNSELLAGWDPP
jgi:hypothetical protein